MKLRLLVVACVLLAGCKKEEKIEHQQTPSDTLHHNVPMSPDSFGKPSTTTQ